MRRFFDGAVSRCAVVPRAGRLRSGIRSHIVLHIALRIVAGVFERGLPLRPPDGSVFSLSLFFQSRQRRTRIFAPLCRPTDRGLLRSGCAAGVGRIFGCGVGAGIGALFEDYAREAAAVRQTVAETVRTMPAGRTHRINKIIINLFGLNRFARRCEIIY